MIEHGVLNFEQVSNLLADYSLQHQSRLVSLCVIFLIRGRFRNLLLTVNLLFLKKKGA